jgi:superfamily II DNA/RNA helicase
MKFNYRNRSSRFSRPRPRNNRPSSVIDLRKYVSQATTETKDTAPATPITHTFADFGFAPIINQNIIRKGFTVPTPIQDQAIPHAMAGKDLLGLANTGTGKTAVFALPIAHKIITSHFQEKALIIAPTRELALQIHKEIQLFTQGAGLFSVLIIGGTGMFQQISALRRRHSIVIGTPGRLKDLIQQRHLQLGGFKTIVLDEVDRMLDMGFIPDVRFLMDQISKERQTMFFSATMTPQIEALAHTFLKDPVSISVVKRETAANIRQEMIRAFTPEEKMLRLQEILSAPEMFKAIIFTRTKHGADRLTRKLVQEKFLADAIHGDKPQRKREQVIRRLKEGSINVLVATDVAARGLDIADISHVINFDEPATYEDYIHRIGRTGRADKKGTAYTFVSRF